MKTKLLALVLLAGGSMFAQTRFSIGITVGGNNRGYYPQTPAYAQQYQGYQAQPSYQQPSYNSRSNNGYVTQGYTQGSDAYGRQVYAPGYAQNQRQNVDRDDDRNDHDRSFQRDRDEDDHDRGYSQDNRQQSGYQNGFRNR